MEATVEEVEATRGVMKATELRRWRRQEGCWRLLLRR